MSESVGSPRSEQWQEFMHRLDEIRQAQELITDTDNPYDTEEGRRLRTAVARARREREEELAALGLEAGEWFEQGQLTALEAVEANLRLSGATEATIETARDVFAALVSTEPQPFVRPGNPLIIGLTEVGENVQPRLIFGTQRLRSIGSLVLSLHFLAPPNIQFANEQVAQPRHHHIALEKLSTMAVGITPITDLLHRDILGHQKREKVTTGLRDLDVSIDELAA